MSAREVAIIRRLKKVVKLPVATIAKGVDRHKKTVYAALEKSWKPSSAGRPLQLLEKEVKHIIITMNLKIIFIGILVYNLCVFNLQATFIPFAISPNVA